jgi:hypothetical protein
MTALTEKQRENTYNEVMIGLMRIQVWQDRSDSLWDLDDSNIKRFKIMMNLYRDHGKEFSGELEIKPMKRKLIYNLSNNQKKKTVAYISGEIYGETKDEL